MADESTEEVPQRGSSHNTKSLTTSPQQSPVTAVTIIKEEGRRLNLVDENKDLILNQNLQGLGKSATLAINERSVELEKLGKTIYRFGLGQSPFPIPAEVTQALRDNAHQRDYLPVKGLWELREAVANFHQRVDGIERDGSDVLIGPGSKELVFLVQLAFTGDLIIPSPCWVSYIPQALIIGRDIKIIHTDFGSKWRLLPKHLLKLCTREYEINPDRPKLLLLNYPGNPEGNSYSRRELEAIANIARQFNILILSDEIYGQLRFDGNHVSIAHFYPEGTIISSGLSKWCGAGGWRLGTLSFPRQLRWLMEAMSVIASETYTSVSAPIQYAAITAFNGSPAIDRFLVNSRRILEKLGNWCSKTLRSSGLLVHDPLGAFYLFIDFYPFTQQLNDRGINSSRMLADVLLEETGVAVLSGNDFARPLRELTIRLSYVNFNGAAALEELESNYPDRELDQEFLYTYCSQTVQGIKKITEWVKRGLN